MKSGISSIGIYVPPFYLSHADLADARSIPRDKFTIGLGNINMSIVPPWDDPVTMAANAAEMAIETAGIEKDEIGLLIVSTESGVDQSKPVASFVQGLLGVGYRTRVYEIKHACYGGTVALMNAINWVNSRHHQGRKALVVTSDIARYGLNSLGEPTQGAGAVAFIVSDQTDFIHFLPGLNAYYSKDVHDFWRPNGSQTPLVDGKYSIDCYLEALDFCAKDLQDNLTADNGKRLLDFVDYFIYHLPFTRMARKACCRMVATLRPELHGAQLDELCNRIYEDRVRPSLKGAQQVGNIYTGSVYMSLLSLIEEEGADLVDRNVGIFSYGSGCGAEFLVAHTGRGIARSQTNFGRQLARRRRVSIEQYERLYGDSGIDSHPSDGEFPEIDDEFSKYVFAGIRDHKRLYARRQCGCAPSPERMVALSI